VECHSVQLRSDCLRARRTAQRTRGHHEELLEAFRRKRLEFKHGIAAAKARSYKELQDSVDSDIWGLAYKLDTNKLRKRAATPSDHGPQALQRFQDHIRRRGALSLMRGGAPGWRHTSGCWVSGRTDGKRRGGEGGHTSSSLS